MPFNIKRFTQLHRSTSMPSKNKQHNNTGQQDDRDHNSTSSSKSSSKKSKQDRSRDQGNGGGRGSGAGQQQMMTDNMGPNNNKQQKMSQISGSRSIDAAEIRRLGGQLTISNPIPIDQPQVTNTLPIRWSKSGPHSGPPRNLQQLQLFQQQQQLIQQQQQDIHRSGYYSDAEDVRRQQHQQQQHPQQQQRRVLTLIRPANGQQQQQPPHHQQQQQQQPRHSLPSQPQPIHPQQLAIRMAQQMPNMALLKSGGSSAGAGGQPGGQQPVQHPQANRRTMNNGGGQHVTANHQHNQQQQQQQQLNQQSLANHHNLQQQQQQRLQQQPHHPQPQRPASTTPLDRFVYQPSSTLFDDDPGIMSEIETSATGFRRGGKIRSSLPIVRTPSKTHDRSLGLVFLQFRSETKRALLPNEITSLDTVKALFVRSFPRQLSMEYLDCPSIRIYIHDGSKDMFYELEDLRDIRDRCVLRIYEHGANGPQPVGGHAAMPNTAVGMSDSEQFGYFSEPEFESEYQSQHIHRGKRGPLPDKPLPTTGGQSQYYGTIILPAQYRQQVMLGRGQPYGAAGQPPQPPERSKPFPGYSQTLPRNAHIVSLYGNINDSNANSINQTPNSVAASPTQRPVSPDLISKQRPKDPIGQMMTTVGGPPPKPQRSFASRQTLPTNQPMNSPSMVGQQYHQNRPLPDRPYSVTGHYPSADMSGRGYGAQDFSGYLSSPERSRMPPHDGQPTHVRASFSGYPSSSMHSFPDDPYGVYGMRSGAGTPVIDEEARVRMQQMERQIVSLTNVVTKALTPAQSIKSDDDESDVETNCEIDCNLTNAQIQRQHFKEEKSVSFNEETSDSDQFIHTPQRAGERPAKPAIKSRTALSTTDKSGKPAPPPKPAALVGYRGELPFNLTTDMLSQLKQIRKKTKDLRGECRSLRRLALQQTSTARETLRDACNKIKTTLSFISGSADSQFRLERMKISAERDSYGHDVGRLDKDLHELETQVEELRSNVINRRCRVNMSHVETMAMVLSRASKTVADLKGRYPPLSQTLKSVMSQEMECCVKEEKFLKDEPDRLETALKRCKKLTGTLVTLKRLASVQEQRSTTNANSSSPSSQLLQSVSTDSADFASRAKRMQSWRRSPNFRDNVNHKIDLWRGFASMPTMPEQMSDQKNDQMYDQDLEPHTIIQVTPATPLPLDGSKTNVLDSLLDELQTFSKPSTANTTTNNNSTTAGGGGGLGVGQTSTARKLLQSMGSMDSTVGKKGPLVPTIPVPPPRSSSSRINPMNLTSFAVRPPTSAMRSNSEPSAGGLRPRSTPPEGMMDGDDLAVPPSSSITSLSSVGSQGSVVEKRFAQSRQELLEQRHQELLKKQRQLQEQYTRLQQLSRGQIPRGLLNDLKKTGSESNIVSKASVNMSAVHGSLRDLAPKANGNASNGVTAGVAGGDPNQKIFETDIL